MVLLCLATVVCLLVSCGSDSKGKPVDTARMESLGNEFLNELDDIIYLRERDEALLELDALVVAGDKTYYLSKLDAFYEDYRVGSDTELLIIFRTKSFVVNKIVFEGAVGYYYRYEFDPANVKAINITSQSIDKMEITEESIGDLRKVIVKLKKDKMKDIVLTFQNIIDEEEQEA